MILDLYQKLEEERVDGIKQYLQLYFSKSKELNETREKTEINFSQKMELISKESEVQQIINKNASSTKSIEEIVFTPAVCKSEGIKRYFEMFTSTHSIEEFKYDESKNKAISSEMIEQLDQKGQEIMGKMRTILANCWSGNFSPADKQQFEEFIKGNSERKIFGECFNLYRTQGAFTVTEQAYLAISELLGVLLAQLTKEEDIDCALRMLILAQTYYMEKHVGGKMEKIFLQDAIQKHAFWQNRDFWDRAIKSGLEEEEKSEAPEGETEEERTTRLQNASFGRLITFAHNMLHFEIPQSIVQPLVLSYAKSRNLTEDLMQTLQVIKDV